eukprot:1159012-Pelagomonas_calceolata.AAC.7
MAEISFREDARQRQAHHLAEVAALTREVRLDSCYRMCVCVPAYPYLYHCMHLYDHCCKHMTAMVAQSAHGGLWFVCVCAT